MDSLNNIPNAGNWGDAASKLNDNFNKVNVAVETINSKYVRNKGYFPTLAALQAAFPSPKIGDTAYVANVASSSGYYIANVVGDAWVETTTVAPAISINANEYAKHGYSATPKTLKQVDDEIVQLAGDVIQLSGISEDPYHKIIGNSVTLSTLADAYVDPEGVVKSYSTTPNILRIRYAFLSSAKRYLLKSNDAYRRVHSGPSGVSLSFSKTTPNIGVKTTIAAMDNSIKKSMSYIITPTEDTYVLIVDSIPNSVEIKLNEITELRDYSEKMAEVAFSTNLNTVGEKLHILNPASVPLVKTISGATISITGKIIPQANQDYKLRFYSISSTYFYNIRGFYRRGGNAPIIAYSKTDSDIGQNVTPVLMGNYKGVDIDFSFYPHESGSSYLIIQDVPTYDSLRIGIISTSESMADIVSQLKIDTKGLVKSGELQHPIDAYIIPCQENVKYANNIFIDKNRIIKNVILTLRKNSTISYGILKKSGQEFIWGDEIGNIEGIIGANTYSVNINLAASETLWVMSSDSGRPILMADILTHGIINSVAGAVNRYTVGFELFENLLIEDQIEDVSGKAPSQRVVKERFEKLDFLKYSLHPVRVEADYIINHLDVALAGYDNVNTFRIPAIEHTASGNILFFNEAKLESHSDFSPCHISMAVIQNRRVVDYRTLLPSTPEYPLFRYPCTLRDGLRNYLFYTKTKGLFSYFDVRAETPICYIYSEDGGQTWSEEIVLYTVLPSDEFKLGISSINAIKHSNGKIIIPMNGGPGTTIWSEADRTQWRSGIMLFDENTMDVSFSWLPIENEDVKGSNECSIIELLNGDLLLDARGLTSSRVVYTTPDMGVTWTPSSNNGYIAPVCLYPTRRYGDKFVRTTAANRTGGGVRLQTSDDGVNFTNKAFIMPNTYTNYGYTAISCYGEDIAIALEPAEEIGGENGAASAVLAYVDNITQNRIETF